MTDLRTAAQQALEALESDHYDIQLRAAIALRAALVEPDVPETDFGNMAVAVAEPVASVTECEACFTPDVCQLRGTCDHYAAERLRVAAPPQRKPLAEPVQEPVANDDEVICPACCHQFRAIPPNVQQLMLNAGFKPPFTAPPQRKPLTEEEIDSIWDSEKAFADIYAIVRAIERAHGIV